MAAAEAFGTVRSEAIAEISAVATLYEHARTGARVLKLQSKDDNKAFTISFGTLPTDNSGCAHIAEHSVLCGSRKYKTKEPFVDLMKGSLNTFLNAMTFTDRTIYPVASRNTKDFHNLASVYLDAVFWPRIHTSVHPFLQEGIRRHIEKPEDPITLAGIVYNEMKGAYSSPDEYIQRLVQRTLFPDTPFSFDSGGDPNDISSLTREKFLEFHTHCYHPSNSLTILYGDGDTKAELALLDSYFCQFDRKEPLPTAPIQAPFTEAPCVHEDYDSEDTSGDRGYISFAWQVGRSVDSELSLSLELLEHMLLTTQGAPLKEALIKAGMGKEVTPMLDTDLLQPIFGLIIKNTDRSKVDLARELIWSTLKKLVAEGIPADLVEGSVNHGEFLLREADFRGLPKGIVYAIQALQSWNYGADPLSMLAFEATLARIRQGVRSGKYFETLIEKYLLNNPHRCIVTLNPCAGLTARKDRELADHLAQYKASLPPERLNELVEQTRELLAAQEAPDSEEAIATIPTLKLADVDKKAEVLPIRHDWLQSEGKERIAYLEHETPTNGIVYSRLLFDVSGWATTERLPLLSLLSYTIGKTSTRHTRYTDLANRINISTGGVSSRVEVSNRRYTGTDFVATVQISCKFLLPKVSVAMGILAEILTEYDFSDKSRVLELVREMKAKYEKRLQTSAYDFVTGGLASYDSPAGVFQYNLGGIPFFKWLVDTEKRWSEPDVAETITAQLADAARALFDRGRLVVSATADRTGIETLRAGMAPLLARLLCASVPASPPPALISDFKLREEVDEGYVIPTTIHSVGKGLNVNKVGHPFHGSLRVGTKVLDLEYLWQRVRVQGSAYGCFAILRRSGAFVLVSFRDPKLAETLTAYDEAAKGLTALGIAGPALEKYIIGCIADEDSPLTPSMKGEVADSRWLAGLTHEDVQREREEILATTSLAGMAACLKSLQEHGFVCVVGPDTSIKAAASKGIIKRVVPVLG
eukprot:TRINITY_DN4143_c0_g1_i1.p1 TRINITY_DN4143_c0_g1~~TRINITY_DN4143_c0_g1_i1.p1  ORF type:complete len:983 (+),score=239.51 TRINITY_DN4143_c0_g1_i1:27-2975(+)